MEDARRTLGNEGEGLAASYLRARGYDVLGTQVRTKFGEIDLVCREADELCFVEVKTRMDRQYGYPEEAVTRQKIGHMVRAAQAYLLEHNIPEGPFRFDVIAIEFDAARTPVFTHYKRIDIPEGFW